MDRTDFDEMGGRVRGLEVIREREQGSGRTGRWNCRVRWILGKGCRAGSGIVSASFLFSVYFRSAKNFRTKYFDVF